MSKSWAEEMVYKYHKEIQKLTKERNQLKQQLINKDNKIQMLESQRQHLKDWLDNEILTSVDHESYYATINEYEEEVKQLKKQLAEKDEKIESYKHTIYMNMLNQEMLELKVAKQDQDKISFAVEQLFLFKHSIEDKMENGFVFSIKNVYEIFDNQIKQLTNQHENEEKR